MLLQNPSLSSLSLSSMMKNQQRMILFGRPRIRQLSKQQQQHRPILIRQHHILVPRIQSSCIHQSSRYCYCNDHSCRISNHQNMKHDRTRIQFHRSLSVNTTKTKENKSNNSNNNNTITSALQSLIQPFYSIFNPSETDKKESQSNWRIITTLSQHLWPTSTSLSTTSSNDKELQLKEQWLVKQRVLLSIGLMISAKAITIQVPFVFKHLVDSLPSSTTSITSSSSASDVSTMAQTTLDTVTLLDPTNTAVATVIPLSLVLGYGISRATAVLLQELRNTIFHVVVQDATRNIGCQVLRHTLLLDLQFHLSRNTGQLSRIMEHGLRSIATVLNSMVFHIVPTLLEVSLVTGIMTYQFGSAHAIVVITTVVSYTTFTFIVTSWRTKFRREMNRLGAEASGRTIDSFLNFETIQYFNNVNHELNRYETTMKAYSKSSQEAQQSLSFLNIGQSAIFSIGLTAVMYLTYDQILAGNATVGDLVLANGLLFQVSVPLFFIGSVYRELKQSFIDMEKMNELLDTKPAIIDTVTAIPYNPTIMGTSITLNNVHFAYPNTETTTLRPILQGTTLTVPHGTTTAIVGSSGCGKSTILRLIYRSYEANDGSIVIGGYNVCDLQKATLQKSIAVIPQDVVLFNETIGYNINYGNLNASLDQVIVAAKQAKIHDTIMSFPAGYDTVVGERGLKLSGGEKQRVSIARAILKESPILLCDEPTSSLDSETEMDIMNNIKSIGSDRTTIIVAHRLSTVQDCDQIVVMHQGRVVESGTHDELIRLNGRYTELLKMQESTDDTTEIDDR